MGICAFNEADRIGACLWSVVTQRIPRGFDLKEILVVASGCTDDTEQIVEKWQTRDQRIILIRQSHREGKSSGLNQILLRASGDLIVFVNADACLQKDALAALLNPFATEPGVLVACGAPFAENAGGISSVMAAFHWELHNRTLEALSRRGLPNHCCDEFMAIRRGLVSTLPRDLVNDGAYFGTVASLRGASVRFCPEARVFVEIPRSLRGFVKQRRRILRGHDQIEDLLHRPSNTLENLFRTDPLLAVTVLGDQVVSRPAAFFAFVLFVLPIEITTTWLAHRDRAEGLRYDHAWNPVE